MTLNDMDSFAIPWESLYSGDNRHAAPKPIESLFQLLSVLLRQYLCSSDRVPAFPCASSSTTPVLPPFQTSYGPSSHSLHPGMRAHGTCPL